MESKDVVMQELFSELTERNKDIMILVAKSINIAQKDAAQEHISFHKNAKPVDCLDV